MFRSALNILSFCLFAATWFHLTIEIGNYFLSYKQPTAHVTITGTIDPTQFGIPRGLDIPIQTNTNETCNVAAG